MAVVWLSKGDSVLLVKKCNERITISVGDFITYEGRPDGVRVESFTSAKDEDGPIGMIYLPWRAGIPGRWATPIFTLRGNPRHIIAMPYGIRHYGEHIDWETVVNLGRPPVPAVCLDGEWETESMMAEHTS